MKYSCWDRNVLILSDVSTELLNLQICFLNEFIFNGFYFVFVFKIQKLFAIKANFVIIMSCEQLYLSICVLNSFTKSIPSWKTF